MTEEAATRLKVMADMTTVDPTPLDPYGRCSATFADLRALLSEREELRKGLEQAALELEEAVPLIRVSFPKASTIFAKAAGKARSLLSLPLKEGSQP